MERFKSFGKTNENNGRISLPDDTKIYVLLDKISGKYLYVDNMQGAILEEQIGFATILTDDSATDMLAGEWDIDIYDEEGDDGELIETDFEKKQVKVTLIQGIHGVI